MWFDTLVAIGVVALQLFILAIVVSWIWKLPFHQFVAKHATLFLRIIFLGAVVGSLIYSEFFLYPPCILCWYQRLAIFPIAIIALTGSLKQFLIKQQVLLFASLGFLIALFHNYLDIFQPEGLTVCGVDGVSCTARYVYEFGYVTIPMMSATVLLAGIIIALVAKRFPQN